MRSTHWKDFAELIGIAAIVGSLIFVGMQMRQTQEIAIAGQYHARASATMDMYMTLQESATSVLILSKSQAEMTQEERHTAANVVAWSWTQFDNHHYQYQSGLMTDEAWAAMSRRIEWLYGVCDQRPRWEAMRPFVRDSFVTFVESLDDRCQDDGVRAQGL